MAKNKIIVLSFFLFISSIGIFGQNARSRVIEAYSSQIGVREATGKNDGEAVEMFLAVTGLGKGYAWCAAFVAWAFNESGVVASKSAWSPSWFPTSKTIYIRGGDRNQTPQAADVFGIYFTNLKRIAHVGFVDDWQMNTSHVITVEGNTNDAGSREGDGVYRKRRLKSQVYKVSRWVN